MSAKKTCVACNKQIPSVALVCVFCSAKQPSPPLHDPLPEALQEPLQKADEPLASAPAASPSAPSPMAAQATEVEAPTARREMDKAPNGELKVEHPAELDRAPNGASSQTRPTATFAALSSEEAQALAPAEGVPTPGFEESPADRTPVVQAPGFEADAAAIDRTPVVRLHRPPVEPAPWASIGRLVMGMGGAVLVALFFMPWHGVSSWQLLETLAGAEFARQLYYLTGGVVLLSSALLPLPFAFRAVVGALVAALPLALGSGGVLGGWRGLLVALALVVMPATYLVRTHTRQSAAARLLALAAVAAIVLLYLSPTPSGLSIAVVLRMIGSRSLAQTLIGIFALVPIAFAAVTLVGLRRQLADARGPFSILVISWAPAVVTLRGVLLKDSTQVYVALALLWASTIAALSLAQLLALADRRKSSA
jgi:hypothetical protein